MGEFLRDCANGCGPNRPHQCLAVFDSPSSEFILYVCSGCHVELRAQMVHFAAWPGFTSCCLPMLAGRKTSTDHTQVTCPDCTQILLDERVQPPEPDWRPAQPVPEDFYAR